MELCQPYCVVWISFAQCPVREVPPCGLRQAQATHPAGTLSLCDSHNLVTLFTVDRRWGGFQSLATVQSIVGPTPASAQESVEQACPFSSEDAGLLTSHHHGGRTAQRFWIFILKNERSFSSSSSSYSSSFSFSASSSSFSSHLFPFLPPPLLLLFF